MKSVYKNKKECSGCSGCKNICPVNAIHMELDNEGFLYPVIDKEICINCNLCIKTCSFQTTKKEEILEVYGVKHKNKEEQLTSRSGGAFTAISDYILKNKGIVYGVNFENNQVFHDRAETKQEADKFKGSKYIQSDMRQSIDMLQRDLLTGRKIVFSGTPCQIGGVKNATENKNTENLYLIDLICHGVPSPLIYYKYLEYIEEKENKKMKTFHFRDKKYGWAAHYETTIFEDGSEFSETVFRQLFYDHFSLRPSCFDCSFKTMKRASDITLADFWGIDKIDPDFYDNNGVSLILINTRKGEELFDSIKENFIYKKYNIEDAKKYNPCLYKGTEYQEKREEFWEDVRQKEFKEVIKKYTK